MAVATALVKSDLRLYFENIWSKSFQADPLQTLFTLLMVNGLQSPGWEPFEELSSSLRDYDWHLKAKSKHLSKKSTWRIALLIYCQITESTAIHDTLINITRICKGNNFSISPFHDKVRVNKKKRKSIPPSATTKWDSIAKAADSCGLSKLHEIIDNIYDDEIRNSFVHSDYILTNDHYRWTEGNILQQKSIDHVQIITNNAMIFIGAFIEARNNYLYSFSKLERRHPFGNDGTIEYIFNSQSMLSGFLVQFSNGNKVKFERSASGIECVNIRFNKHGHIEFIRFSP